MHLRSRCANAAHAESTMVSTASHINGVSTSRICSGKIGSRMRRKPYTPIFDMTPVSSIVTGPGASAYAAGSQVWNGTTGTFTAKPRNAPKKTSRPMCDFQPMASPSLAVISPRLAMSASSMKSKLPVASRMARKLSSNVTLPTIV